MSPNPNPLEWKDRIVIGGHFAEIIAEETSAGTIFHWIVQRLDAPGVIVLGEQSTYALARQEAERHLMSVDHAAAQVSPRHRSVGA